MKYFVKHISLTLISLLVVACGGSGSGGSLTTTNVNVSGSVGDGPIIGATITVRDNADTILATQLSDANANFNISTTAGSNAYPVSVSASGGTDVVSNELPDFTLYSISMNESENRVNINPYSTMIYKIATKLGGIDSNNVSTAKTIVLEKLHFGLDLTLVSDPIKTTITASNVAHFIKANEVFSEMIRRARDMSNNTGASTNAEGIMDSLAADLTDGVIDGQGTTGTSQKIAAYANLASAYVMVEAINNSLKVNGVDATNAMNNAVSITTPSSILFMDDVRITGALITQTIEIITAANLINPDSALTQLKNQLQSISPNRLPENITTLNETALDSTLAIVDSASSEILTNFNNYTNNTFTNTNTAPVINGTPTTSVLSGSLYSFTPTASDADSDTLTFSISNKPAWASFNSGTGALSGTAGSVGTYSNIVISVTDGSANSTLSAFSINVTATNSAPSISGTPANSVAEGTTYNFTPTASDSDGDTLTFSITNKPSWAAFNTTTGQLSGTPGFSSAGNYGNIAISVSDGQINTGLLAFSITVSNTNRAPVISGQPTTSITASNAYLFTPGATDADGDSLTFSITNKPAWTTFNTSSGQLSGTPVDSDAGTYNVTISVSDGSSSDNISFSIIVSAQQSGTTKSVTVSWTAPQTYDDGSPLPLSDIYGYKIYSGATSTGLSATADVNNSSATSTTVANLSSGTYYFAVTAYDANGVESTYSSTANVVIP